MLDRRAFLKAGAVAPFAFHAVACGSGPPPEPVATPFPFVDGLCLSLDGDLDRLGAAGLSGAVLDVSVAQAREGVERWARSWDATTARIQALQEATGAHPRVDLVDSGPAFREAHAAQRTALMLQVQGGGELLDGDLTRLEALRAMGLRIFQLTHHHNNSLAGGVMEPEPTGLTPLGQEAVREMNRLGLVPDVSHASDQTALDTVAASEGPVVLSHGAARALVPNARCAPDDVIRAIADSGGVMGVFMMSFWLTTDPVPTPEAYVRQIRHVMDVGGIEAVGVANDFPLDGDRSLNRAKGDNAIAVKNYLTWWESMAELGIEGFDRTPEHVAIPSFNRLDRMLTIDATLEQAGFTPRERELIMGGNWIRVYG